MTLRNINTERPSQVAMATPCLDEDAILDFVERRLDPPREHAAHQHIAACPICRRLVSELARVATDRLAADATGDLTIGRAATDSPTLARGTPIGRYVIVSLLGRGGMGVVYRAYDPDLNRQVAVKLVALSAFGTDAREQARLRLLREAQALAKLSHPNVVAVHDVGVVGDDVFIAMEFVEGQTLRTWLAERTPTPREILRVFGAAGEGLAAAHQVGVVHRDFKPDNVMIGNDGRVRVLDFGLARLAGRSSRPSMATLPPASNELTGAGALIGTPAYMSPEQDAGIEVDAPSDQFSYCVALYEALYRRSPHAGTTYIELALSRTNGAVASPPKLRGVGSRIRRALLVGLRPSPKDRHANLGVLLDEIRASSVGPRTIAIATGVALAVGVLGASLVWKSAAADDAATSCRAVATNAATVWTPERRANLATSFAKLHPHGAEIAARLTTDVEAWTAQWIDARADLCEMARRTDDRLEESRSAERLQCLQRRMTELDGALTILGITDDANVIDHAPDTISAVHRVADCAQLATRSPSPDDIETAKPILALILRSRNAQNAGKLDDAVWFAASAVTSARTIKSPAIGVALQALGDAQGAHGDLDAARATYRDAAVASAEIREDGMVADAWLSLLQLTFRDRKVDDSLRSAVFAAKLATTRLPADDARVPKYHYTVGTLDVLQGLYTEAIAELELAISEYQHAGADRNAQEIAAAVNSLGLVYADQGDWAKATAAFERMKTSLAPFGPDTPQLGIVLSNLAVLAAYQERDAEAERLLVQAMAIFTKLGPNHPLVGEGEYNLAQLYAQSGRCDRAAPHLAAATRALAGSHGVDAPVLAMITLEEARCAKNPKTAVALATRARAVAVAHPVTVRELPEIDFVLAQAIDRSHGDHARAVELAAAARAAFVAIGAGTAARVRAIDRWLATHSRTR